MLRFSRVREPSGNFFEAIFETGVTSATITAAASIFRKMSEAKSGLPDTPCLSEVDVHRIPRFSFRGLDDLVLVFDFLDGA